MKRCILPILMGILSIVCLGASEPEMNPTAEPEQIAVPEKPWTGSQAKGTGYTIQNLYDWTEQKNVGPVRTHLLITDQENADDTFRENVNILTEKLPEGVTEEQYFHQAITELKKIVGSRGNFSPYTPVAVGDLKGWKAVFEWKMEGLELKQDSYVFFKDGTAYVVTCSAIPSTYDTYQPKFKAIVGTLQLTE